MPDQPPNSKQHILQPGQYERLRQILHELSNVSAGLLISAGLLTRSLPLGGLRTYCEQISEAAERSAALVREARSLLLKAPENIG